MNPAGHRYLKAAVRIETGGKDRRRSGRRSDPKSRAARGGLTRDLEHWAGRSSSRGVTVQTSALMVGIAWLLLISAAVAAPANDKDKDKEPEGKVVDTGSFGVFRNGHRLSRPRNFPSSRIPPGSVATSEFKTEEGGGAQAAPVLWSTTCSPPGGYINTSGKKSVPARAQAVIVPNDNLLVRRSTSQSAGQAGRASFPASHLDQRAGRLFLYPSGNPGLEVSCDRLPPGQRVGGGPRNRQVKFGAINPHQRASQLVSMAFTGKEKDLGPWSGTRTGSFCAEE